MLQYYNYFKNYGHQSEENLNNQFYDPIQGLSKGNMSPILYRGYKNYIPKELIKDKKMELKAYNFAIIDLRLYLDTHPNDPQVKNLYDQYVRKYDELLMEEQTTMNGNISEDNEQTKIWLKNFPWECDA